MFRNIQILLIIQKYSALLRKYTIPHPSPGNFHYFMLPITIIFLLSFFLSPSFYSISVFPLFFISTTPMFPFIQPDDYSILASMRTFSCPLYSGISSYATPTYFSEWKPEKPIYSKRDLHHSTYTHTQIYENWRYKYCNFHSIFIRWLNHKLNFLFLRRQATGFQSTWCNFRPLAKIPFVAQEGW